MRQLKLALMMILLPLLLVGCGGSENEAEEAALGFRTAFIAAGEAEARVNLRADYGDYVRDFTIDFSYVNGDQCTMTLVAPETIAGLTATLESGSAVLKYDGIELVTGTMYDSGLTPLDALPYMMEAWRGAVIEQCAYEKQDDTELLRISFNAGDNVVYTLWADGKTPVAAEIAASGTTFIFCEFETFTMG